MPSASEWFRRREELLSSKAWMIAKISPDAPRMWVMVARTSSRKHWREVLKTVSPVRLLTGLPR